jgi:hypothetical protein
MSDFLAMHTAMRPELVWGLFTRGVGVVFLISFASLAVQIVRGAGREGGMPIARRLDKIREDFGPVRCVVHFPTLLWLSSSDTMLRVVTFLGIGASVALIVGGPWSPLAMAVCYVCYLSLDLAIGLIFPWDCVLFEVAFLGMFLPPTHVLPNLAAMTTPAPALAWAYRLAVFRVMFGFGKLKFIGATLKDLAYLKGFLVAQPLPSPVGWYAQKLPVWVLRFLVVGMFITEIPVPFFVFFPGILSAVAALLTIGLMVGIIVMGSFGYFSLVTMVVCITLFDNVTPTEFDLATVFASGAPGVTNAVVLLHTIGAAFVFPFNSWIGQSWHLWSTWFRLPAWMQWPFHFYRFLHPFRWLHPYGVFPPNTYPGVKMSLLVEVSWDGKDWKEVEFEYSPSNPMSAPKFVAPHHPRGDQAVIYETFGLNPTSLISSMVGPYDPYAYGVQPAATVLLQRILEGHGNDFMRGTALKERKDPPVLARITTVMLEPATLEEHRATGRWWRRSYVGPHTPPRRIDERFWQEFLPEPEMWHPENVAWRRRSKLKSLMDRAAAGEDPMRLALEGTDLTATDVERFWNELVPTVGVEPPTNWDGLPDAAERVRGKFTHDDVRKFQRLLGRFSVFLLAKLEPHYLGKGFQPPVKARTYLHLWMAAQHVIGRGREAYLAVMADPLSINRTLDEMTLYSGLYFLGVFRFDSVVFEAQKLRLLQCIAGPHGKGKPREPKWEEMTAYEQLVANLARTFSGYFDVMPFLRQECRGPRFDQGFPENYPWFEPHPDGSVHLVKEYQRWERPPAG